MNTLTAMICVGIYILILIYLDKSDKKFNNEK